MNPPRTWSRYVFDVIFGVIVPVVFFIFDPIVLKTMMPYGLPVTCGDPILGRTSAYFVYPAAGIGILSLLCWLILGHRLSKWAPFFSGALRVGALMAITPAMVFSIPAILLAFPVWLTAYAYARNAKEAWDFAEPAKNKWMLFLRALGGVVLVGILAGIAYYLLLTLFPPLNQPSDCRTIFSNE